MWETLRIAFFRLSRTVAEKLLARETAAQLTSFLDRLNEQPSAFGPA